MTALCTATRTLQAQASTETIDALAARIKPAITEYCVDCHNAETAKSGIRVDQLTWDFPDQQLFLWKDVLAQIDSAAMPPEGEQQPDPAQREALVSAIRDAMNQARARNKDRNGSVRRLTVSQYRNTLRTLLGLQEDLTDILPPDGISKDGFANNGQVLGLSPLQMEYYFEIAEKALARCIVDEKSKPTIQNFRVELGKQINGDPCKDALILGANSLLLDNADFVVNELQPVKPFEYQPFAMQRSFDFIEGYEGNGTVRGWRKFESIYHAVFACMRGTEGYPKGKPYETVRDGLLLRPAIPSTEIFGESSTYGPHANFKISLRELPEQGNFRVTVKAAKFDDGLLLGGETAVARTENQRTSVALEQAEGESRRGEAKIEKAGVFQVDLVVSSSGVDEAVKKQPNQFVDVEIGERVFSSQWRFKPGENESERRMAFVLTELPAGALKVAVRASAGVQPLRVELLTCEDSSEAAVRFRTFQKRAPQLGVHLGLRRDCGSTMRPVGKPQAVTSNELQTFVFEGAIADFPSPDVEKDNVNYLAGIREIGVRSEFTDGRDIPRLLIRSVEFEGPILSSWPPPEHHRIFVDSASREDAPRYAQEIIQSFMRRAYRRPVHDHELELVKSVWSTSFAESQDFATSIKDALLVVLTSPQFLFLIERSAGPEAEQLEEYELASKLSYFLWDGPPDEALLERAASGELHARLVDETERMMGDARFQLFLQQFVRQWLSLEKLDVVETDLKRFPQLTREMKQQLGEEPLRFIEHLIENNLPVANLVRSDFIVANDAIASYYALGERTESGFAFQPIAVSDKTLGGLLGQAGIMAGLSDGRESNPVKRGAWFARKIIADPPDDPPPNVPELQEDSEKKLSLRERLEMHRNQEGCAKCHSGIDPWGVPFEAFDAAGKLKTGTIDTRSKLPDGTDVADFVGLKDHLADSKVDRVAYSFMKHLASYATGRTLTYNETVFLEEEVARLKPTGYPMRDLFKLIVQSDLFLKK